MNRAPKVSVLIPTYNFGHYLGEAIESVLCQTFTDFELIVVDNNSSDNTDDIVERYSHLPNVQYFKNEFNVGMSGNWNKCLLLASGEYLKFLCADDMLHPECLEQLAKVLDSEPSVTLVSSAFQNFGSNNEVIHYQFAGKVVGSEVVKYNLLHHNAVGTPTQVMFRRNALWVGSFKTEFNWINDTDMWNRLLMAGDYYSVPKVLSYIRVHEQQATNQVLQDFSAVFNGYTYVKYVQFTHQFNTHVYGREMHSKIKGEAKKLIMAVPSMILKKRYDLIKKVLPIAYAESLLLWSAGFMVEFFTKSALKKFFK